MPFPWIRPGPKLNPAQGSVSFCHIIPLLNGEKTAERQLSERTYIATAALKGILSSRELQLAELHDCNAIGTGEFESVMARLAVRCADALLAALQPKTKD